MVPCKLALTVKLSRLCFHFTHTLGFQDGEQASNVFKNKYAGPDFCNNPQSFWPEIAIIAAAFSVPGEAEGLAGESG
ncbi:hypothetical protein [Paraflavitalea devenefica]|uniref:hypothetical protein n=1 Tax=Paraflavitalea devenefica TaxID=2716334 RepID=UPI001FE44C89|nr:hypothetical protein [Paraflavitalea devenefica]